MPNLNAKLVTRIAFLAVVDNHDVCPVHFRLQMLLMYYSIFPQTFEARDLFLTEASGYFLVVNVKSVNARSCY